MKERLSWEDIQRQYPDVYVGLAEIDWEDEWHIHSAIVNYVGKSPEEVASACKYDEDIYIMRTFADCVFLTKAQYDFARKQAYDEEVIDTLQKLLDAGCIGKCDIEKFFTKYAGSLNFRDEDKITLFAMSMRHEMSDFLCKNQLNEEEKKLQHALLLYPYIHNESISYGYAAKLLGMDRLSLISLYESIGIPYHRITHEELQTEVALFNRLKKQLDYERQSKKQLVLFWLGKYLEIIKKVYGAELLKVVLYGSYARGDFDEESDVDLMILIDAQPKEERKKLYVLIDEAYDIKLDSELDIQPIVKSVYTFEKWKNTLPFYRNVENEGEVLYNNEKRMAEVMDSLQD